MLSSEGINKVSFIVYAIRESLVKWQEDCLTADHHEKNKFVYSLFCAASRQLIMNFS